MSIGLFSLHSFTADSRCIRRSRGHATCVCTRATRTGSSTKRDCLLARDGRTDDVVAASRFFPFSSLTTAFMESGWSLGTWELFLVLHLADDAYIRIRTLPDCLLDCRAFANHNLAAFQIHFDMGQCGRSGSSCRAGQFNRLCTIVLV